MFAGVVDEQGFLRYDAGHHAMTSNEASTMHFASSTDAARSPMSPGTPPVVATISAWSSSYRDATVRAQAPGELPIAQWEKLTGYAQVLKPLPRLLDDEEEAR